MRVYRGELMAAHTRTKKENVACVGSLGQTPCMMARTDSSWILAVHHFVSAR